MAMQPIGDLHTLLAGLQPVLQAGRYAFAVAPPGIALDPATILASVREAEGLSVVMRESDARAAGLDIAFTAAWITLTIHSDLASVGLTAAVSTALAHVGIGCNVIAGVHHDHLLVPFAQASQAMAVLESLQRSAA